MVTPSWYQITSLCRVLVAEFSSDNLFPLKRIALLDVMTAVTESKTFGLEILEDIPSQVLARVQSHVMVHLGNVLPHYPGAITDCS